MKPCDPICDDELSIRCDRFRATCTQKRMTRERERKRDTRTHTHTRDTNGIARGRLTFASRVVYVLNIKIRAPSLGRREKDYDKARLCRGFEKVEKSSGRLFRRYRFRGITLFSGITFIDFSEFGRRIGSGYLNISFVRDLQL